METECTGGVERVERLRSIDQADSAVAIIGSALVSGIGGWRAGRRSLAIVARGGSGVWTYLATGQRAGPLLFLLLAPGGLGLGLSNNPLIAHMTSSVPDRYASDLSGVISTNAQMCGALGVAALGSWYLALAAGSPVSAAHPLLMVVAGFAVLALAAAAASYRATAATEQG